jgi:hypothetical protein
VGIPPVAKDLSGFADFVAQPGVEYQAVAQLVTIGPLPPSTS